MKIIIILFSLLLSACSTGWHSVGKTTSTYEQADEKCDADAWNRFPMRNKSVKKVTYDTFSRGCHKEKFCGFDKKYETIYSEFFPKTSIYIEDINEGSRNHEYILCMKRKGWHYNGYTIWD